MLRMFRISELKFFDTNQQTPETIAFDMEASCPSEEKPYPVSMVMNLVSMVMRHNVNGNLLQNCRTRFYQLGLESIGTEVGKRYPGGYQMSQEIVTPCDTEDFSPAAKSRRRS